MEGIVTRITLTKRFSKLDKAVTNSMIPRGLAAAVLATYPITMGLPNAEAYPIINILHYFIISNYYNNWNGKIKNIPPPDQ